MAPIPTWEIKPNIWESHSGCPYTAAEMSWGAGRAEENCVGTVLWDDRHLLHLGAITWDASSENGNQAMPHPAWGGIQPLTAGEENHVMPQLSPQANSWGNGPQTPVPALGPQEFPSLQAELFPWCSEKSHNKVNSSQDMFIKGPPWQASALLGTGARAATVHIHRSQASSPSCILTTPQTDPSPLITWVSSPLVKNLHLPRLSIF